MSTTISGDTPANRKAPPPITNGAARKPMTKKALTARAVKSAASRAANKLAATSATTVQGAQSAPTTQKRGKRGRKPGLKAAPVRSIPIGIKSTTGTPNLMAGFIQSMPAQGTQLTADARTACKATFASLIDWVYPSA